METDMDGVTLASLLGGALLLVVYLIFAHKARAKPDLQQAVILCTSWASFATAAYLGFQVCVAKASDLGVLSNQRVTIFLGVAAVMWVSVTTVYGAFLKIREDSTASISESTSN